MRDDLMYINRRKKKDKMETIDFVEIIKILYYKVASWEQKQMKCNKKKKRQKQQQQHLQCII